MQDNSTPLAAHTPRRKHRQQVRHTDITVAVEIGSTRALARAPTCDHQQQIGYSDLPRAVDVRRARGINDNPHRVCSIGARIGTLMDTRCSGTADAY
jgi:hypothetical protein